MAFSVDEMMATISGNGGLTKASKFLVQITPPPSLQANPDFAFFCDSAVLPGVSMMTDEVRMFGYGNVEKRAYAPMFTDVQVMLYNDAEGRVFKFFHEWMQTIYSWSSSPQFNSGLKTQTLNYPKEYYGLVDIFHFNDKGGQGEEDAVVGYQLIDAYPISVGDVQVDWNASDTLVRVPVSFAYTYWNSYTLDQSAIDNASQQNAAGLDAARQNNVSNLLDLLNSGSSLQNYVNRYAPYYSRSLRNL